MKKHINSDIIKLFLLSIFLIVVSIICFVSNKGITYINKELKYSDSVKVNYLVNYGTITIKNNSYTGKDIKKIEPLIDYSIEFTNGVNYLYNYKVEKQFVVKDKNDKTVYTKNEVLDEKDNLNTSDRLDLSLKEKINYSSYLDKYDSIKSKKCKSGCTAILNIKLSIGYKNLKSTDESLETPINYNDINDREVLLISIPVDKKDISFAYEDKTSKDIKIDSIEEVDETLKEGDNSLLIAGIVFMSLGIIILIISIILYIKTPNRKNKSVKRK